MRFRRMALTLYACLALGAFAANAAQAAEGEGWTIGTTENQTTAGTLVSFGTHERVSCKKHGTSSLTLTSTLLGAPVELTASGVDCLEKAGSTNAATIDNTTSRGHSEGVLTFTGVTVVKPPHCSVPHGELTTAQLTDEVIMDTDITIDFPGGAVTESAAVLDRFFPEAGGGPFVTLTFEGAECVIAGNSAQVTGSACGEAVHTNAGGSEYESNTTGTLTKVQTLLFGEAQQSTGNTKAKPCSLRFGGVAANLSGAVDNELGGFNAGKPFGAD